MNSPGALTPPNPGPSLPVSPPPGPPSDHDPEDSPAFRSRRRGAIARLSKFLRDEINNLILDGVPFPEIRKKLAKKGVKISDDSLSRWHLGGYQDWLQHQDWLDQMRLRHESMTDFIRQNQSSRIHEAILALIAFNVSELLNGFDPATLKREFAVNPAVFLRFLNSVSRLAKLGLQCEVRHDQEVRRKERNEIFQTSLRQAGILP